MNTVPYLIALLMIATSAQALPVVEPLVLWDNQPAKEWTATDPAGHGQGMAAQTNRGGNSYVPGMKAFDTCLYTEGIGASNHLVAGEKTADRVIEFLKTRKAEKPFFVYMAPPVTHDPRVCPKEFMDLYEMDDLAGKPEHAGKVKEMMALVGQRFAEKAIDLITQKK